MKKLFLILLLGTFVSFGVANAQQATIGRSEIFISYGAVPTTDFFGLYTGIAARIASLGHVTEENSRSFGAVNAGYYFYAKPWLGIGGAYSYANLKQDLVYDGSVVGNQKYGYHNVMGSVKFNWFRRPIVTLYSRAAAGVTIATESFTEAETGMVDKTTEVMFAFQVSPIGIEVGRALAGFAEVGIGNMGVAQVGLRYRF